MDVRAAAQAEWLREQLGDEFHHHCSFASPIAELQAAKMLWLKQYAPDLLQRAALVTSLPAWLTLRLDGVSAIDRNLAAMSGLYSLSTRGWWDEMLELCGLEARQLPALVDVGVPVRAVRTCADIALASDIEFIFAGNDHSAGALANGCSAGEMIVTLGTALVAYRHAGDRPGPYAQQGCWGPYPGGGYYELAVLTQGCAALDWARHELLPGEDVAAFFACAGTAGRAGAESEVFFYPERMERADAWTGAGECPQRALAVLEGIGFALRRLIADGLHADPGLRSVTALGGGSRSDVWLQIIADILACSVRRGRGDSLQGAAMMANPHTPQRQPQAGEMFTPTAHGSAHYRRLYERWKAG
jgi:xylulokinase